MLKLYREMYHLFIYNFHSSQYRNTGASSPSQSYTISLRQKDGTKDNQRENIKEPANIVLFTLNLDVNQQWKLKFYRSSTKLKWNEKWKNGIIEKKCWLQFNPPDWVLRLVGVKELKWTLTFDLCTASPPHPPPRPPPRPPCFHFLILN